MAPLLVWSFSNLSLLLVAYLFGSLPTGYLIARWLKGIDIREYGSGSTGATNVLRVVGKKAGAAVFAVDLLKGAAAIALVRGAYAIGSPFLTMAPQTLDPSQWLPWMAVVSGLAAVLGHSKSIWLGFTGGKSVATGLGLLLALHWQVGLMAFGVFGITFALSRIVSLSSIAAATAVPILMLLWQQPLAYLWLGLLGGGYVIVRHRSNIQRLLAGTEPRLGQSTPDTELPSKS